MASFAFRPLHQVQFHLFSFPHCKHSSPLNAFQFYSSFRRVTVSKHAKPTPKVQATKLYRETREELSGSDSSTGPNADYPSGLPSLTEISKKDGKRERYRSGVGEAIEKRDARKERNEKVGSDSKRRMIVGSGDSSTRFRGEVLDKNVDKRRKKGENSMVNVVEKVKRSKKFKIGPPETILRLGLDMCSKRGDIVGAIKLYDLAKKDGIKMGQYHYAVLLYLCSSAATGMVQPAKSGSGGRSLSPSDPVEGNSVIGSESVTEFGEMAKWMYAESESSQQNAEGEHVIEHLGGNGLAMNGIPVEVDGNYLTSGHEDLRNLTNDSTDSCSQSLEDFVQDLKNAQYSSRKNGGGKCYGIQMSDDVKRIAIRKGFEIYNDMRREKVAMNEATLTSVARMAMTFGDGDMAFDVVKQMVEYGISPRLRSYGPALAIFCSNGDVEKAFMVETHMLEHGVHPEEPELESLLRVSVEAGKSERVYYVLHRLRTCVRQVSEPTADLIERWFKSKVASRVGKRKWNKQVITQAMENGGGGWHGKGWLGQGKWIVFRSAVDSVGSCKICGVKLATIDLDPEETENFAKSVVSIASRREKNSSFQKFQKWLDYYGPFEAVVDAANVGLYSQRKFKPSKVNAVVNGIRQMLPSRKWPLIVLHNRRITGEKMDEPFNRSLIEKWKNADALYATPTGSNDDWYWLYAAIKCRCLIVTNDEMRDHLFQLLGNDFFPKWKERHQVHFSFTETGPVFHMPPPCSIVIQESEKGHWHIPIVPKLENEDERIWLCCTRAKSGLQEQDSSDVEREPCVSHQEHRKTSVVTQAKSQVEPNVPKQGKQAHIKPGSQESRLNSDSMLRNRSSLITKLESAENIGGCVIDFQI